MTYEQRERVSFYNQITDLDKLPLSDRQEARAEFHTALAHQPEMIAERIGWLLQGAYGKGSYDSAWEVIRKPRMNQVAWLSQVIASLEWGCPMAFARLAWKSLDMEQQETVNSMIRYEIHSAQEEAQVA